MGKSRGLHRAARATKGPVLGAAGLAAAGAAVIGMTPTLSASPHLLADVYYLPGTKIGEVRTEPQFKEFADAMIAGSIGAPGAGDQEYIDYPGGFWPVSTGGLNDPTYDESVAIGLAELEAEDPGDDDVIFGFSQGAVVASKYKALHPDEDITYVLVANPNKANGGILQRFKGLYVPILDISFNGATEDTGADTVDIVRQYDGWGDFPAYPLNPLATANAIVGIALLHGDTQDLTDPEVLEAIEAEGDSRYYQEHGNTTYYVIPTERLPLLMPFDGIVPDPVLTALDAPLRYAVELGYERSDYSKPTTAGLAPVVNPVTVAQGLAEATVQGVQDGLAEANGSTPSFTNAKSDVPTQASRTQAKPPAVKKLPKLETRQRITPRLPERNSSALDGTERHRAAKAVASTLKNLKSLAPKLSTEREVKKPERPAATDNGESQE